MDNEQGEQLGNIKSFHTELPNSSAGDTQTAFLPWDGKRSSDKIQREEENSRRKMFLWAKQGQVGWQELGMAGTPPSASGQALHPTEESFVHPNPARRGKRIFPVSLTADL